VRRLIGATGAVWIDGDGDGQRTSAYAYARRLVSSLSEEPAKLIDALGAYDQAVAAQAASLLQGQGVSLQDPALRQALSAAGPQVEQGFNAFADAWRASQIAKGK
jgi:sugar/nucleoside kinase (ribokinase family)